MPMDDAARKAVLDREVESWVRDGWRIETQTGFTVVVVKGKRVNHLLHLFITFLTLAVWAVVWIGLVLAGGEKHRTITVDLDGDVSVKR